MGVQGEPQSIPQGNRGTISLRACIVFGAVVGGFAALVAIRFGEAFGSFLPVAAAAVGALAGRVFFSTLKGKTDGADWRNVSSANVDAIAVENAFSQPPDASVPLGSEFAANSEAEKGPGAAPVAPPPEPEWPVETYEVQVKLDLARSYVELGDPELAVQYLQEVLEMELAIGKKLSSEVLQETREPAPESDDVGLPD